MATCFRCERSVGDAEPHAVLCVASRHKMHLNCFVQQITELARENRDCFCHACSRCWTSDPPSFPSKAQYDDNFYPLDNGLDIRGSRAYLDLDATSIVPPPSMVHKDLSFYKEQQDVLVEPPSTPNAPNFIDVPLTEETARPARRVAVVTEETVRVFLEEHGSNMAALPDAVCDGVQSKCLDAHALRYLIECHADLSTEELPRMSALGLDSNLLLEMYTVEELVTVLRLTFTGMCTLGLNMPTFVHFREKAFRVEQVVGPWQTNWYGILECICRGDVMAFLGDLKYTAEDLKGMGFGYPCLKKMPQFNLVKLENAVAMGRITIQPVEWFLHLGMPKPPASSPWYPVWTDMYEPS